MFTIESDARLQLEVIEIKAVTFSHTSSGVPGTLFMDPTSRSCGLESCLLSLALPFLFHPSRFQAGLAEPISTNFAYPACWPTMASLTLVTMLTKFPGTLPQRAA